MTSTRARTIRDIGKTTGALVSAGGLAVGLWCGTGQAIAADLVPNGPFTFAPVRDSTDCVMATPEGDVTRNQCSAVEGKRHHWAAEKLSDGSFAFRNVASRQCLQWRGEARYQYESSQYFAGSCSTAAHLTVESAQNGAVLIKDGDSLVFADSNTSAIRQEDLSKADLEAYQWKLTAV